MVNENLKILPLSSLSKVFADSAPIETEWSNTSMMRNEVYSFQIAYHWNGYMKKNVQIRVRSELSPWISIRKVGLVPSEMPCHADHDDNVLRTAPGLYPDALYPLDDKGIVLLPEQWRTLWFTITPEEKVEAGIYSIGISFCESIGGCSGEEELGKMVFQIEILKALLPKQKLLHTEWFHSDCLATWYEDEVFSEGHWKHIEQFVTTAAKHGMNMILTPIFTPPLDTKAGGERPTVQLVDVEKSLGTYRFGFNRLKQWIDMCRAAGIEYFEFSHLFTQWGAAHAPKIMATADGLMKRIFGWDTDAAGEEYRLFLSQFLPELLRFIEQNHLEKHSYFHVSDEPRMEDYDNYKKANAILSEYLQDYPVIDALSDYHFYETGAVKNPIPASDHIKDFLNHQVPDLWTYYCCGQYKQVSNRFFNMPSARNRILGMQLYKFNIKGFLHWGYNFWYSQYSIHPIDPFRVTDAGYAFPSGDAFVVYPGEDGPIESIRLEVFYEALQDLRALELLEGTIGRAAVLALLEDGLEYPITFSEYPKDAEWMLLKREQINRAIESMR